MSYIYAAAWACLMLQLWVRPALAHLLPLPLAYYAIKCLLLTTGLATFLISKLSEVWDVVRTWGNEKTHQNYLLILEI